MKQKVAKPIVLLMIAVGVCMIPMLGYYPLVQSWYGAMCNVKGLAVLGWPVTKRGGIVCSKIRLDAWCHRTFSCAI
mgnify:FL=1